MPDKNVCILLVQPKKVQELKIYEQIPPYTKLLTRYNIGRPFYISIYFPLTYSLEKGETIMYFRLWLRMSRSGIEQIFVHRYKINRE